MNALIDELLTLSRLTGGVLDPVPVDLSALAREIADELDACDPGRTIDWRVAAGLHVAGNPGLPRAALANLLGNAWKYSAGRVPPRIEFGSRVEHHETVYFVADNGAGFDAEAAADRLFRPFQRFHSKSNFEGTGIGLSIVCSV